MRSRLPEQASPEQASPEQVRRRGGVVTVTGAESVAVTLLPDGGVPVAVATFVKLAVTFASEQL